MIHNRTALSLSIATVGGYLVGSMTPESAMYVGLLLTFVVGCAALWITPHAETVALQWREKQRLDEEESA